MKNLLEGKTAFIVDDTAFMRAGLTKQLIELGFGKEKITHFENGRNAFEALLQVKVDVVFSDWNMPIMDGLEFLKQLRGSNSPMRDVPVVMITTESEKSKVVAALQYKISGYIIKPVMLPKLEEVLELIFGEQNE